MSGLVKIGAPGAVAWRRTLESSAFIWSAPLVNGGVLAVRCGSLVACLEADSGNVRWQKRVSSEDLDSRTVAATSGVVVTSYASGNKSSVVALRWVDGGELWNTPVPGEVPDGGITTSAEAVWSITAERGNSRYSLRQFELASGKQHPTKAPIAANHPLATASGVVLASKDIFGADSGVYLLRTGSDVVEQIVKAADAYRPVATDSLVAVVVDRAKRNQHELTVIDLASNRELWSTPTPADSVGADAGQVVFFESAGERRRAVLASARDGSRVWSTPDLENEPVALFFSGDTVCVVEYKGMTFLDRGDGTPRGRIDSDWTFSWGGGLADGRLFLGHHNEVVCYVAAKG